MGPACIHGLTMIKTHSEEPFKGPVPIMESLIGGYSARKVFSAGGKSAGGYGGRKKTFFFFGQEGSNNHFVHCLVYVKFIQRSFTSPSLLPSLQHSSSSFFFLKRKASPLNRRHPQSGVFLSCSLENELKACSGAGPVPPH